MERSGKFVTSAEAGGSEKVNNIIKTLEKGQLVRCCELRLDEQQIIIIDDTKSYCSECPVQMRCGSDGAMITKMEINENLYGIMGVSISKNYISDKEEQDLLLEIANDIAFALHNYELTKDFKLVSEALNQSEDALNQSQQRIAQVMEGSPISLFVLNKDHQVTHWNKSCEILTGFSKEEMINTRDHWKPFYNKERPLLADLVMNDSSEEEIAERYKRKYMASTLIQGGYEVEDFFPGLGESGKWLSLTSIPLSDTKGNINGSIETLQDITERKKVEEEILKLNMELEQRIKDRTMELEIVNRDLKDFAYIVSHDLKAPLRAIGKLSSWIHDDYIELLDNEGKEKLDLLVSRVNRMDKFIDGILQYSRIGRIDEPVENIDMNNLINEIIEFISLPGNIKIIIKNDLPKLLINRTRIEQVFQNLIVNAVKFMDKNKGKIIIGSKDSGAFWEFYISDNGPGIDEKYHKKIFQIFQTLAPRDDRENTGIGLTLVKKIIEQNGGEIWLESKEKKGSIFYFTIPK